MDGVPKKYCSLTLLSLTTHLEEGVWTGRTLEPSSQNFHKGKPSTSHANSERMAERAGGPEEQAAAQDPKSMSKGTSVRRVPR